MTSEYDKSEVGKRIRLVREAKGMRPTDLAAALGISPQKLWNYESGTVRIPPEHAGKLCSETGVDFDYIYRGMIRDIEPGLKQAILKASRVR